MPAAHPPAGHPLPHLQAGKADYRPPKFSTTRNGDDFNSFLCIEIKPISGLLYLVKHKRCTSQNKGSQLIIMLATETAIRDVWASLVYTELHFSANKERKAGGKSFILRTCYFCLGFNEAHGQTDLLLADIQQHISSRIKNQHISRCVLCSPRARHHHLPYCHVIR